MLKLKLSYFGLLMPRADSLDQPLKQGKTEGRRWGLREWDGWMASLMQRTWRTRAKFSRRWWPERPGGLQSMGSQRAGRDRATEHSRQPLQLRSFPLALWEEVEWSRGLPGGSAVKGSTCQCRRRRFSPWVRRSPGGPRSIGSKRVGHDWAGSTKGEESWWVQDKQRSKIPRLNVFLK